MERREMYRPPVDESEDNLIELNEEDLEFIDAPRQETAKLATAYGGHQAEQAMGMNTAFETSSEVSAINEADIEANLREKASTDIQMKIESGTSPEDLLDGIEGELEEIEMDIDDLEEDRNQETILKEKYLRRSILDAQKQTVLKAIARNEAGEIAAK